MSDDDKEKKVADDAKKSLDSSDEAAAAADAGAPQSTRSADKKQPEPATDASGTGDHDYPHEEYLVAETDRVNVGVIGLVTTVIMATVVVTVIGVYSFFGQTFRGEVEKKQLSVEDPTLREIRAMEVAHLGKYQWIDQSKGMVRIPKDRAKELVLADYGKMAAYQPGATAPAPAPEPATSAPAPSGSVSAMPAPSGSAMPVPSTSASAPHHDAPAPSASAPKGQAPKK
ncbi:MAG: hypothetical protein ACXWUG_25380 [Polyangiales bacterium]